MDFRGLSAQGCLVLYQGCFGGLEGIMNCGAATAFLPNFVRFPSPRGLHSSTVQQWRAPGVRTCPSAFVGRRARPYAGRVFRRELSCPVSAASAAAAPAARGPAARGPASAGRASARRVPPAGVTPASPVVPARRAAGRTARRRAVRPAGPPASGTATAVPGAAPSLPGPDDGPHDDNEHNDRQDDADDHGVTLLPFPRSGPRGPFFPFPVLRDWGMPARSTAQSRVEELQSLGAGWPA